MADASDDPRSSSSPRLFGGLTGAVNRFKPRHAQSGLGMGHVGPDFPEDPSPSSPDLRTLLLDLVRKVRRRWRLRLLMKGAAIAFAAGLVSLMLSAWALELLRFSAPAILTFRIALAVVAAALVGWFVVRPLLRRATDEQVALYLEEHEPGLEATVMGAVEATRSPAAPGHQAASPALAARLIETAIEKCEAAEATRRIERPQIRRAAAVGVAVALAGFAAFVLGPAWLRQGASALLLVSESLEAASPYRIDVLPGNATVPRGSDQSITATLVGFESENVELLVRKQGAATFESLPFVRNESGRFEALLFDLAAPSDYFVQAARVRSPVFALDVVDLPYVERLDLEYRFPAYTGLEPRLVENGGDVVVLTGTEVRLKITSTIPTPAGRLLINQATAIPLVRAPDGTFTASFVVEQDGFYRIELEGRGGTLVNASPQHTIDALDDQPPSVTFDKPRRDLRVSPVEEVFVQARAADDHGIADLRLIYSVNGGPEKTIRLFGGSAPRPDVSAGHTFYLEELQVEPGDSVSYFARASDTNAVAGARQATSDLYFLQIRPFSKDFKPAMSQGGGGGGGGGGAGAGEVGALSEQQRRIISATFNVIRDRRTYTAEKLREHMVLIALMQSRLRDQVEGLVTRLTSRLEDVEGPLQQIGEILPKAIVEMRAAETRLQAQDASGALPAEQRALMQLQKAEELYELEVTTNRNAGGGGGGGANSALAEDLADLFELEMDKLANQYETMQRAGEQSSNQQMDELAERLKELARRQEQEAERQRRRAAAGQSSQGGGASQRELAEQAEEAARRLERLSREQDRPDLAEAARRMQEAADAMRQAAASGGSAASGQAGAALDRLRDAQRRLERERGERGERDVREALDRANELVREQREIADEVDGLGQGAPAGDPGRSDRMARVIERKNELESKVADLEKEIDRSSGELWREQKEAARKMQEAAGSIRDNKVKEKIRYSRGVVQGSSAEYAKTFEDEIGKNLEDVRDKLGQAASALGKPGGQDAKERTLERARQLARGVESLDQRLRDRADQNGRGGTDQREPGQQGQDGKQGQNGQQGQSGQQGQGGQQGQSGQSGAAGQEGQQGSSGQQGSGEQSGGGGSRESGRGTADGRSGDGDTTGPWGYGGGYGSRRPGTYTGEDIRQFRGEARQWSNEAQTLGRELREQGIESGNLDEILRALRELDSDRVYKDAAELERLQTFVSEGLKRFEYGLRRRLEGPGQDLFLAGSDEVPAGFRPLVEEYYRSLSAGRPR